MQKFAKIFILSLIGITTYTTFQESRIPTPYKQDIASYQASNMRYFSSSSVRSGSIGHSSGFGGYGGGK